ncbi:MerC domain-containing protein [Aliiglaciecola sp. CAU 1673]|uniref:MerC domain-containing protein n=1 Tax=Aliiglaciecola sp. CAU 1673 TaxID=3032595 RepID=UPI0023DA4AC3|nr:MerC domain-containing protein [Aliiglaciecola sp. CAU 1673]MDF2178707.1 MerC domain-containing protein [Aliiglaciecola sp. CAU 1673]
MSNTNSSNLLDKMGIWASSLCALHCLLLPILVPLLPFVGASFFAENWFERSILTVSMIIGFWALLSGFYRYHRQLYPLYSLVLGGLIYWNKDMFGHDYEPFTIAIGALLIVAAHILNLRLCQACHQCDDH